MEKLKKGIINSLVKILATIDTSKMSSDSNLLSTLPANATYITAAKPKAGLISYDVLSYVDSTPSAQKFGFMCLGKA